MLYLLIYEVLIVFFKYEFKKSYFILYIYISDE